MAGREELIRVLRSRVWTTMMAMTNSASYQFEGSHNTITHILLPDGRVLVVNPDGSVTPIEDLATTFVAEHILVTLHRDAEGDDA